MNKKFINITLIYSTLLIFFSFFFNYYYANLGVFPLDTFAFFDTAFNILIDRHPFKDIWVTTGPLVDYLQSIFFKIFGLSWSSYVIHGSVINSLIVYFFFKILINFNLNKHISFFYAVGLSVLCYSISGTPFAYIHSYVFSLLSILIFFYAIKNRDKKYFFFLPIVMTMAFLSMQNPSTFINFTIILFSSIFFFRKENRGFFKYFIGGVLSIFFVLIIFFLIFKIPVENFIQQYFLFPLTMADYRISGDEMAHISLSGRFTFRNVIGHFKFINILLLILLIITVFDKIKNKISFENLIINFSLILTGILLIFNQLITSNQTFIFSFIPFIGGFIHVYLYSRKIQSGKLMNYFIILMTVFCVTKYHFEYNEKRKFMDLQNTNLNKFVDAKNLDEKFKGLKWITPGYSESPNEEISLLKQAIKVMKNEERNVMVLTEYQFFSIITEKNLNIPNRWYTHDNNSYPLDNHKYFKFYKKHIEQIINKNKIKVVYQIGRPSFSNFKIYLSDICYNILEINKITKIYELKKCN